MIWRSHDYCSYAGPQAREIYALCRADASVGSRPAAQLQSLYCRLNAILAAEGGLSGHVVREFVFLRNIRRDLEVFLRLREGISGGTGPETRYHPASTFVEQPPLDSRLHAELAFHAVIPAEGQGIELVGSRAANPCGCGQCPGPSARAWNAGQCLHLNVGNIFGSCGDPYAEVGSMYRSAEGILRQYGMSFRHVVRTWIQLRRIERDYGEFNRARRDFYRQAEIYRLPASTGIEGATGAGGHNFVLSLQAVRRTPAFEAAVMTSATLNEAPSYGADFSRGMKVADGNKTTLWISGTASVDESGGSAHAGDIRRQLERTLLNISALLAGQGASFRDVVSLVSYLKDPGDGGCLQGVLAENDLAGVPNATVRAAICRPEPLCEVEAVAVLPPAGFAPDDRTP